MTILTIMFTLTIDLILVLRLWCDAALLRLWRPNKPRNQQLPGVCIDTAGSGQEDAADIVQVGLL